MLQTPCSARTKTKAREKYGTNTRNYPDNTLLSLSEILHIYIYIYEISDNDNQKMLNINLIIGLIINQSTPVSYQMFIPVPCIYHVYR